MLIYGAISRGITNHYLPCHLIAGAQVERIGIGSGSAGGEQDQCHRDDRHQAHAEAGRADWACFVSEHGDGLTFVSCLKAYWQRKKEGADAAHKFDRS